MKQMVEHDQMLEETKQQGMRLVERWSKMPGRLVKGFSKHKKVNFLEGIPEGREDLKVNLAILFENTLKWLRNLEEQTRMQAVGSFEKYIFPIIRAVYANLVATELVTTQALTAPTGLVFYFDALYGSTKGNIQAGTTVLDARTGPAHDTHFTDEIVEEEPFGTGDGVTTQFGGGGTALAHIPIRPSTVRFTDGTQLVVDDGNGNLLGNINLAGVNTVNYTTGAFNFTFAAAPANGEALTVNFEYNMEANEDVPMLDLLLRSAPVTARRRALRARWSIEAQQDFSAYHGINAEVELVAFMANVIAKEINYQIVRHLQSVASAGAVAWNATPPVNVPWIWHKETFYDTCVHGSNLIFEATQRGNATWLVAGINVCNVIETMSKFKGTVAGKPTPTAGIKKIGALGEFTVYKDPSMNRDEFLMGLKDSSFLNTGYIYAPYLGLYTTPTIVLDDMMSRKGMMQRCGFKVVNSNFYVTGSITGTLIR